MKHMVMAAAFAWLSWACMGCFPQEHIVWSPDGGKALVLGEKVYLSDPAGALTPVSNQPACAAAWFPDGQSFVLVQQADVDWTRLSPYLTAAQREEVQSRANRFLEKVAAYTPQSGPITTGDLKDEKDDLHKAITLYLAQSHDAELTAKLGSQWAEIKKPTGEGFWGLFRYRVGQSPDEASVAIAYALQPVWSMRVSPTGKAVAYSTVRLTKSIDHSGFFTVSADGTRWAQLARESSFDFSWSPDGRYLAYVRSMQEQDRGEGQLGIVTRTEVWCGKDGQMEPLPATQPASAPATRQPSPFVSDDLAVVVLGSAGGLIVYLDDGRILFSAQEVTLPISPRDAKSGETLFLADPSGRQPVCRALMRPVEKEFDRADFAKCRLSPDGERMLRVDSEYDVKIINLASGKVKETFKTVKTDSEPGTVPVWRNNGEICFIAPPGPHVPGDRNQVVLVTLSKDGGDWKVLSADWPREAGAEWLWPKEPTTQPTSEPATQPTTRP